MESRFVFGDGDVVRVGPWYGGGGGCSGVVGGGTCFSVVTLASAFD